MRNMDYSLSGSAFEHNQYRESEQPIKKENSKVLDINSMPQTDTRIVKFSTNYWLKFSLYSLLIVASLGTLMRYKMGFDFPFFEQKNIQHAHSHFAFSAWVAHTLYVFMIHFLQSKVSSDYIKQYRILVAINLICAYGMLVSFFLSGYSPFSIALSTATIAISCFFAYFFFKDLKKLEPGNSSKPWFKAALIFNMISAFGTFYLAYMMMSKHFNERMYLASIYYYLHFQYNGFFIFSCMGLAINQAKKILPGYTYKKITFRLFVAAIVPAYFLSILWVKMPTWLYIVVVAAAFTQLTGWITFITQFFKYASDKVNIGGLTKFLMLFVTVAFSIKLMLQVGSTIPSLSKLAFGFRPIVIAYLHLVLLAVISVFLLAYAYSTKLIQHSKATSVALSIFAFGVFANEFVLGIQGVASFGYVSFPYMNEILFGVSALMVFAMAFLIVSQGKRRLIPQ